jgi:hypothetical protein
VAVNHISVFVVSKAWSGFAWSGWMDGLWLNARNWSHVEICEHG